MEHIKSTAPEAFTRKGKVIYRDVPIEPVERFVLMAKANHAPALSMLLREDIGARLAGRRVDAASLHAAVPLLSRAVELPNAVFAQLVGGPTVSRELARQTRANNSYSISQWSWPDILQWYLEKGTMHPATAALGQGIRIDRLTQAAVGKTLERRRGLCGASLPLSPTQHCHNSPERKMTAAYFAQFGRTLEKGGRFRAVDYMFHSIVGPYVSVIAQNEQIDSALTDITEYIRESS